MGVILRPVDYFILARGLEDHHVLFYKLWELGHPNFTTAIDTAAVSFNKEGECIDFMFNPNFWASLDDYSRQFVISHECLHVVLDHGSRTAKHDELTNIAFDIVVNNMLVRQFGFDRSMIAGQKKLCWIDTIWPHRKDVLFDQNCEYYYNLLTQDRGCKTQLLDDHSKFMSSDQCDAIARKLNRHMNHSEADACNDMMDALGQMAGSSEGDKVQFVAEAPIARKPKFESIIANWSKKLGHDCESLEQWTRINRRFALVGDQLILPSEMEIEEKPDKHLDVWLFQDASGSCDDYAERFFHVAESMDRKRFTVHHYCFDTRVQEVTERTIRGGGGTKFSIIESYIQTHIKKTKSKYPEAVFVLTDGYGNNVIPEFPDRWYVLLTTDCKKDFHPKCRFFDLREFE